MISNKRQDYLSIVFRNVGFGFFAPFGTIFFQWVVFKKDVFGSHFYFAGLTLLLGFLSLLFGYLILKDSEVRK